MRVTARPPSLELPEFWTHESWRDWDRAGARDEFCGHLRRRAHLRRGVCSGGQLDAAARALLRRRWLGQDRCLEFHRGRQGGRGRKREHEHLGGAKLRYGRRVLQCDHARAREERQARRGWRVLRQSASDHSGSHRARRRDDCYDRARGRRNRRRREEHRARPHERDDPRQARATGQRARESVRVRARASR